LATLGDRVEVGPEEELMAENKTQKTGESVKDFLDSVENETRRDDAIAVAELMKNVTGNEPKMWGSSIIGFGDIHLKYESGREIDYFKVGLSPRKASLTLYLSPGFAEHDALLARLGKHSTGKGCLYISDLADIDRSALRELIEASVQSVEKFTG
jgi:hypothetical protein